MHVFLVKIKKKMDRKNAQCMIKVNGKKKKKQYEVTT